MWFRREQTYVVLVKGQDGRWMEFTALIGKSPEAAIDQVNMPGTFRAVDARAWGREYERPYVSADG